MNQPSFRVFLNKKTGEFVLSRQFLDKHGLHCDTGDFARFSIEEMRKEGVRFAAKHFAEFETRTFDEESEFQQMSPEQEQDFFQNHDCIWVYRPEPDEIVFWPQQIVKRQGRFIDVAVAPEDSIRLSWPTSEKKFFEFLMEAFRNVP